MGKFYSEGNSNTSKIDPNCSDFVLYSTQFEPKTHKTVPQHPQRPHLPLPKESRVLIPHFPRIEMSLPLKRPFSRLYEALVLLSLPIQLG